ncbi:MAG: hypothetical protein ACREF3_08460, partial [Acetobacteraceae bacterium]
PRIEWTDPGVLQIVVENLSYVTVRRSEYQGVRIDLRFDPDDPTTRAAWLKWLSAPQGYPTSIRVATVPSPAGNWIATVDEVNDGRQFFSDDVVTLISTGNPAVHAWVLYVATTEEGRGPVRTAWVNAGELRVTAPNRSYINGRKREFHGIRIDLRFDPDDPTARAAWLKRQYAPASPPPDE